MRRSSPSHRSTVPANRSTSKLRRTDDKKCPHGFYGGLAAAPAPAPPDDDDDGDPPMAPAASVPGGSS